MKINKVWHQAHKMPKNPTAAQRKSWHEEHQQNCDCWKSYTKSEKSVEVIDQRKVGKS